MITKNLFITINLSWLWNLVCTKSRSRNLWLIESGKNWSLVKTIAHSLGWLYVAVCVSNRIGLNELLVDVVEFQILNKISVHVHCSVCISYTIWLVLKCLECVVIKEIWKWCNAFLSNVSMILSHFAFRLAALAFRFRSRIIFFLFYWLQWYFTLN